MLKIPQLVFPHLTVVRKGKKYPYFGIWSFQRPSTLKVLKHLEENGKNISQTSREFGIDRKNVRRSLIEKDKFKGLLVNREVRIDKVRYIRTAVSKYPLLGDAIVEFIKIQRE